MPKNIRDIRTEDFFAADSWSDKIRFLLKFAVLAPSTHNSQPWLFKIQENSCKIYFDPALRLPQADPRGRDLYISLGSALENLVLAAKYFRIYKDVTYYADGQNNLAAEVVFQEPAENKNPDLSYEKLVEAIKKRSNARGVFEQKPVPDDFLKNISLAAREYLSPDLRIDMIRGLPTIKKISSLTAKGLKIAYRNSNFRKEMSSWMHSSMTKALDGIPGYALKMPFILSFIVPTAVRFLNLGSILAKLNYKSLSSAPLICIISAKENNPIVWLKTGQLAERLMLEFTAAGLKTSIFVSAIEMGDLYKSLQEILSTDFTPHLLSTGKPLCKAQPTKGAGFTPQFLFAAGFMKGNQKSTPRFPAEDKIITK